MNWVCVKVLSLREKAEKFIAKCKQTGKVGLGKKHVPGWVNGIGE